MVNTERRSSIAAVGRWVGAVGLLASLTPRAGIAQQSAVVQATVRVVVSAVSEQRALVAGLVRHWQLGAPRMAAQGSLALVRLRVVAAAGAKGSVAAGRPAAIVDIQYLRN